jgi:hypothetical protein
VLTQVVFSRAAAADGVPEPPDPFMAPASDILGGVRDYAEAPGDVGDQEQNLVLC